jgi:adenylate cyclase
MRVPSKILIVDDEPLNVDYLEQELEYLGYETIIAVNGQEALQRVKNDAPDLILLDVMMPVMDGLTVCRLLKENQETRLIPIVIMTALDGIEDRIAGIKAGADDFLTKPVDDRELMARIETTLKLKHSVDRQLGELRRAKDHLAKFVPEAVRRLVISNSDAPGLTKKHERDVTALFVDISGYTKLSEQLPLTTLNAIVERYFSVFLDLICEAGGDMNETTGDGFVAIFHDSDRLKHPVTAVDTALSLLGATESLNQATDQSPLAIHMGRARGPLWLVRRAWKGNGGRAGSIPPAVR